MRIRQNFLPRNMIDWLCFLLINVFVPIVFVYELAVILPEFHEPGSPMYCITIVLAIILIFEIMGNYTACLVVDTSVDFENLVVPRLSKAELEELGWHHCDKCDKLAPPRSWHCEACEVCILKRDHHCIFTGCCIGQENHRYFVVFIIYLLIGSLYAFVYNSLYLFVLHHGIFFHLVTVVKIVCPMLMLLSDKLFDNMSLMFYNLNILAVAYSFIMSVYHAPSVFCGGVC
ncbi:putative ZDHHC-type palmitoyltransferase 4 [Lucilia cuprina]|nr:putative ZDHHC-type palmitoyltransferase 4 [Lucilia cuprina]KAI8117142.1 putative ZDHHC-type palmitoyltransferase 4 [Lucilia cuprina]